MTLPIPTDYAAMEAELTAKIPTGEGWIYEPKWDGFRCLAFRDGREVELRSKAGKPLGRYFPDVLEMLGELKATRFVLDGELVIPVHGELIFDELLLRIHPAESRVKKLAEASPAHLVLFDLLVDAKGKDRSQEPLSKRRAALEEFAAKFLDAHPRVHLSPCTDDVKLARRWLAGELGGLDGVMAKLADLPYATGERTGMKKVKRMRTAECVVGGFRWTKTGDRVASLLLGLHNEQGELDHVGFCSALNATLRVEATEKLEPLRGGEGFSGRGPVGKSRWRKEGTGEWEAVRPEVVVEVEYDHFTGGRFRHGTRFLRWRPDKDPAACLMRQVEREERTALGLL
jgi:ATP-dependent DNA ligase